LYTYIGRKPQYRASKS